jgi:hypothetical protein
VYDALGDPLVVKAGGLLTEMKVLDQRRPSLPGAQRVVGVLHAHALIGRQSLALMAHAIAVEIVQVQIAIAHGRLLSSYSSPTSGR